MNKLSEILNNKRYWVLVSLIYLSLIYSTSISWSYGPENTIANAFFNYQIPEQKEGTLATRLLNINVSRRVQDNQMYSVYKERYPDFGEYPNASSLQKTDFWKLYDVYGDAGHYLHQTEDFSKGVSSYKFRVLPTFTAATIHKLTGLHVLYSWVLMNVIIVYMIGLLFTYFLKRCYNFSNNISLLGGVLAITSVGITRTLSFPMVDPSQYFFFLLALFSLKIKNDNLYIISAILGTLSKELLIIVGVLYFVNNYSIAKSDRKIFFKSIVFSLLPFIVFLVVRVLVGGPQIEMGGNFIVSEGEIPVYAFIRLTVPHLIGWSITFFLTFSFLWFGLLNIKRDRFIYINTIFALPLVILATFFLSAQVTRQTGILFPLIITSFLFFFKKPTRLDETLV